MNNDVRQSLRRIVQDYGVEVIQDRKRAVNLLKDSCPGNRLEVNLITAALEENIGVELASISKGSFPSSTTSQVERLTQRLATDRGLALENARWAVESLAFSLNIIDDQILQRPVSRENKSASPVKYECTDQDIVSDTGQSLPAVRKRAQVFLPTPPSKPIPYQKPAQKKSESHTSCIDSCLGIIGLIIGGAFVIGILIAILPYIIGIGLIGLAIYGAVKLIKSK